MFRSRSPVAVVLGEVLSTPHFLRIRARVMLKSADLGSYSICNC